MMTVWRMRGKIIRTVLCCVVYDSCAEWYAHTYEQFLQVIVGLGLSFVFAHLLTLSIFLVQLRLFCSHIVCFCIMSIRPNDWLAKTYPKWPRPILWPVGRTTNQSINQSVNSRLIGITTAQRSHKRINSGQRWPWIGSIHGLDWVGFGWVGLGPKFPDFTGLGWVEIKKITIFSP